MNCPVKSGTETNYDLCISCPYIGNQCNGPNLSVISTTRWCEWISLYKESMGWNNAQIAELSGVSLSTVCRVMSGTSSGLTVETKYRISYAMIFKRAPGKDPAKSPCAIAALGLPLDTDWAAVLQENADLKARLQSEALQGTNDRDAARRQYDDLKESEQRKIEYLKKDNEFYQSQLLAKDKLLDERADFLRAKDKIIALLASLLGLSVLLIAAFLIIDVLNPDLGFFWRETLSSFIG